MGVGWKTDPSAIGAANDKFSDDSRFARAGFFPGDSNKAVTCDLHNWTISVNGDGHYALQCNVTKGQAKGFEADIIHLDGSKLRVLINQQQLDQQGPAPPAFMPVPGHADADFVLAAELEPASSLTSGTNNDINSILHQGFNQNARLVAQLLQEAGLKETPPAVANVAQLSPAAVDLHGWDFAMAVSVARLNKNLQQSASTLGAAFSIKSGATSLDGKLGLWQIRSLAQDPGSQFLIMTVKLDQCVVTSELTGKVDCGNAVLVFQVNLGLVTVSGNEQAFQFNMVPAAITPIAVETPTGVNIDAATLDLVKHFIPQCMASGSANITYFLAKMLVGATPSGWFTPASWRYTFANVGSPHLVILGSQSTNPPQIAVDPNLFAEVDTNAPDRILAAVGKDQFCRNIISSVAHACFPAAQHVVFNPADDTVFDNTGFDTAPISTSLGSVAVHVNVIQFVTQNGFLQLNSSGSAAMPLNITMSWDAQTNNAIGFSAGHMMFFPDPSPTMNHEVNIPWYDYLLIIAGIPGLIVSGLEDNMIDQVGTAMDAAATTAVSPEAAIAATVGGMKFSVENAVVGSSFYIRGTLPASQSAGA